MIRLIHLSLLVAFFSLSVLSQVKYTWIGGSGDWQTASNWSPNGIRANADTAS